MSKTISDVLRRLDGPSETRTRERLRIRRAQRKALSELRGLLENFPSFWPRLAAIDNATKAPRRARKR